jgi:diaminopimelate decarboxylase
VVIRDRGSFVADVVGPICESGDFLAKGRMIPKFERGDLMDVMSAGAYGFSMASNYNSRPRIAEVLVKDKEFHVIRKREDYDTLVKGEKIPAYLK